MPSEPNTPRSANALADLVMRYAGEVPSRVREFNEGLPTAAVDAGRTIFSKLPPELQKGLADAASAGGDALHQMVTHVASSPVGQAIGAGLQGIDIATEPLQQNYDASQQMMKDMGVQAPSMVDNPMFDVADVGPIGGVKRAGKAASKPMTNSAGASIHPSEKGVDNFWRWFGESQMKDAEGQPLLAYHATAKSFDTFKPGGDTPELSGKAIWFSPDKKWQPAGHNTGSEVIGWKEGANVMPSYLKIEKPFYIDAEDSYKSLGDIKFSPEFPYAISDDDISMLKAKGYDGVINMSGPSMENHEYMVFDPSQIKSATGNTGDFSKKANAVTKAKGGPVKGYAEGDQVNLRPDGTPKGQGWMGVMKTPSGGDVTELSVGVNLNGEETLIPLVVPTLNELEVKYLLENAEGRNLNLREGIGLNILLKAQQHAADRVKDGNSPFADVPEYAKGDLVSMYNDYHDTSFKDRARAALNNKYK